MQTTATLATALSCVRLSTRSQLPAAANSFPPAVRPYSIAASHLHLTPYARHPLHSQLCLTAPHPSWPPTSSRRCFGTAWYRRDDSAPPRGQSPLQHLKAVSTSSPTLVFTSTSTDPFHNLSLEHHLLQNSQHDSHILFLYTNRPCVVIGRNQNPWAECNLGAVLRGLPTHPEDTKSPLARDMWMNGAAAVGRTEDRIRVDLLRRRSGGGAVFHSPGNLNYCVISPNDKSFNRRKHGEMVVRALRSLQSSDSFMSRFPAFGGTEVKVNERHDIVMRPTTEDNWLKVSGSAFKLTRGRALHHGTLLVASPYLSQISPLLNSLYKDNFTLKGVSSVRSPVGNLFSGECSEPGRDELSQAVQQAIISEFSELYAAGGGIEAMQLSDQDCHESENASIAQGVKELQSDEWRFCQTPRFSFRCPSSDSRFAGFEVNRGYIERISLDYDDDNDPVSIDVSDVSGLGKIYLHDSWGPIDMVLPDLAKAYSDAKNEPDYEKLSDKELDHHGPYWRSFLEALMTSEEDRGKLDDCFPDWSSRNWRIGVI